MIDRPGASGRVAAPRLPLRGPVLITLIHQFTDLFGGLARRLRDEHGMSAVLLHAGALPNARVYDLSEADFRETIDYQALLVARSSDEFGGQAALAAAAANAERRYSTTILQMIRVDRHLGQYFANGADTPASAYGRKFSYEQAVDMVLRLLDYFETLFDRLQPAVVITVPADTARMALAAVAQARGVPVRILSQNYSNNALQWRVNDCYWPGGLAGAFAHEAAQPSPLRDAGTEATAIPDSNRTAYARRVMLAGLRMSTLLTSVTHILRRALGDVVKRRRRPYGGYRLGGLLASVVATWLAKRRAARAPALLPTMAVGQPYVFYPLVVEPETTLQGESPMADNQLTVIDWLAKTLPGGWRLVIKEHPGFTYPRPGFFWAQIRRYPNVDIAAIYESGERLAQDARIVAVINSTLGMQAASAGVPVLTFNPNWWGRFLPHVAYAGNYEDTAAALRRLADDRHLPAVAERRHLGAALARALDVNSIALEDERLLLQRALARPTPARDVEAVIDALVASLDHVAGDGRIPFSPDSAMAAPGTCSRPTERTQERT